VVVSPEAALLECYRFFAREEDPWFHVQGNWSWSCAGKDCGEAIEAWGSDHACDRKCAAYFRRQSNITVSLSALNDVLEGIV